MGIGFRVNKKIKKKKKNKKKMKNLSDCEPCRKRLTAIIVSFAVVGLVLGTKEIVKQIKNYKNEKS
ncbi:hypothetical protein J4771_02395 [Candidatus Kaistella beijingensis]|uniref:hypothetical protein n=1 Tax=Candidatus Kaistella beijingensis TaxID=2820270 RepID=UPI001CC78C9F|nr:hypothetical protein [Candidatus Kaistella beijingensis]UBB90226.1 hypothetical protein J4771_02395 [Candidatus Kaistella beijingensis]